MQYYREYLMIGGLPACVNEFIKTHPEYDHNEDYQIAHNDNDYFEIYMGNWFYEYQYEESEMEKDLRYNY